MTMIMMDSRLGSSMTSEAERMVGSLFLDRYEAADVNTLKHSGNHMYHIP